LNGDGQFRSLLPGEYTAVVRGENGSGDDALIGGLMTANDSGEFVVRPFWAIAGIGLSQELLAAAIRFAGSSGSRCSQYTFFRVLPGCLSRRFPYFHPESTKKSELRDLKREF
jgi:hypothetical protein